VIQDLVLRRGARVEGRVFGPDGKPVAGASIGIGHSRASYDRQGAVSRDDGSFVFPVAPAGDQILRTHKKGMAPDRRTITVPDEVVTHTIEVRLERGYSLSGIIRGADGTPLPDAHVSAKKEKEYLPGRGITDGEGRFEMRDLPAGEVTLELFTTGYVRQTHDGVEVGRDDLLYAMERAATLAGRVVDGVTGEPIDTFTIRLSSASHEGKHVGYGATWAREGHSFTGTDGYWTCDDEEFPAGTDVGVEAHAAGYAPTKHVGVTAVIDPKKDASVIKLFRGTVVTGDVLDPDGRPVSGVTVKLEPHRQLTQAHDLVVAKSDAGGRYRFENVSPGEYALHADHERFAPAFFAPLYVARGDVRKELSMVFTLPGRIEGLAVDASGAPRAGIKVQLTGHDGRLTREAITNKTGRFVFENLGSGKYNLALFLPIDKSFSIVAFGRSVELKTPASVEVDLVPEGTARIEGRIDGKVPEGGGVSLYPLDPGPPMRGTIAKDGRFLFERVEPGRYMVNYMNMKPHAFARSEITIADGDRREITLEIKKIRSERR
ncbi:MAG: carboxypeptidase-like regulatory domain-containing protein, partial [Planctomycetota bacterium]|nr:carboxypeptidase-like regulatory domain-containing protein [Planctomycetota bacterium]